MNFHHLAEKIIQEIKSMLNEQIIICDVNGIIISSTDSDRVGDYHEGSALVIKNRKQLIITSQLTMELKGVKTGINLPLFFNNSVIGVIGITGEIEKVKPFGEIVRKMTELLINENYYNEQIEFEHRAVENFIFDLLQGRKINQSLMDRAETLGISLLDNKRVILLAINQEDSTLQKKLWQYVKDLIPEKNILIRWGNNRLFWMHTPTESNHINPIFLKKMQKSCESIFSIELSIGVGDFTPISNLYRSYEQALTAINYSTAKSRISYYTDLRLELCLQDITDETKKEFLTRTIGDLIDRKQLIETLKVFLHEDTSIQKTAKKLFIHINTLNYRLSKIHQMTGLDPKRFKNLVILYLAVIFLEEDTKN